MALGSAEHEGAAVGGRHSVPFLITIQPQLRFAEMTMKNDFSFVIEGRVDYESSEVPEVT